MSRINFIFLSPYFPPSFRMFCKSLNDHGVRVLGIGDANYEDSCRDFITEYYKVPEMEDYDCVYRAVGFFTHKYGRIHYIESLNEHWLSLESKLRDDFNIPTGLRHDQIVEYRKKSVMKRMFEEAGIPVGRGIVTRDREEVLKFASEVGFPIIAKPDCGVGAIATFKVTCADHLIRLFEEEFPKHHSNGVTFIFEEFLTGSLTSYDGLVGHDGKVIYQTSLVYGAPVLEFVLEHKHVMYYVQRDIDPRLIELGQKAVKAFGLKAQFFHIEFFQVPDSSHPSGFSFVALEANLRVPGGMTIDMWNISIDADISREYAKMIASAPHPHVSFPQPQFSDSEKPCACIPFPAKYFCVFTSRKLKEFEYTRSHEEIKEMLGDRLVISEQMPELFHEAMGEYAYVSRARTIEELQELTHFVHEAVPKSRRS